MSKLKIAVDIDSTVYDFTSLARNEARQMAFEEGWESDFSTKDTDLAIKLMKASGLPWPEWRSPGDLFGAELWSKILDRTHAPNRILVQEPYEDSVSVINDWIYDGAEVFFITSRDPDETAEATEQWLIDIGIVDPTLLCTGRVGSKIPTLIMKDTNVLIDDRPQTLVDFAYEDHIDFVAAIGIQHPYNQGLSDIPRLDIVKSWAEIPSALERRINAAQYA